jgi:5-methyltetrahydropteroyltriglutamate--homocysteine methyltransferase
LNEFPKFDDVGSFPLPEYVDKELFKQFYWTTYKAIINEVDIFEHRGIYNYFIHPFLQSFQLKLKAGVEIVNYPQHMDMYKQFLKPLSDYETEPNVIDPNKAFIPEMFVFEKFAESYFERTGYPLNIKLCITGPIEMYIKKLNFTIYLDMALNFAKSVNSFLKNSIINTKYMKTSIISVDEPSFGYVDLINIDNEELIQVYDKTIEGINATHQFHIHTLNLASIPLQTKNFDVITCEYASNKANKIPKRELDHHDKFIRVGITRTNVNNIMAEALDSGVPYDFLKTVEGTLSLVDSKDRIKNNLLEAIKHYGERLKFVGPDCGLSGWYIPEAAYELLHRTYEVIEEVKKIF